MLRAGGAEVTVMGFRRRTGALAGPARVLGRTRNGRLGQRLTAVAGARLGLRSALRSVPPPDVILARNLETLPLAVAAARRLAGPDRPRVVYEVLDIHRLMLRRDAVGRSLRAAERALLRRTDLVLVSSAGFEREYFSPVHPGGPPVHLVENRVVTGGPVSPGAVAAPRGDGRLVLGWFGILRCRASLDCLDAVTRASPGRFGVLMRGRPALDAIPDFHDRVAANPDLVFDGPYAYPDDLPGIYGAVDLAWLVDRYDAGLNSDWLMPNRFYESGLCGVPPVALAGTEVAREMARLGIGCITQGVRPEAVARVLSAVTPEHLEALRLRQRALPVSTWASDAAEARGLVARLHGRPGATIPGQDIDATRDREARA